MGDFCSSSSDITTSLHVTASPDYAHGPRAMMRTRAIILDVFCGRDPRG